MITIVYFVSFAFTCVLLSLSVIGVMLAVLELVCRVAWPVRSRRSPR